MVTRWRWAICSWRLEILEAFSSALLKLDWIREIIVISLESMVFSSAFLRSLFSSLRLMKRFSLPSLMRSVVSDFERVSLSLSRETGSGGLGWKLSGGVCVSVLLSSEGFGVEGLGLGFFGMLDSRGMETVPETSLVVGIGRMFVIP